MTKEEHKELASLVNNRENTIISYDDCSDIRKLYPNNELIQLSANYSINGFKTSWVKKPELIILPNHEKRSNFSIVSPGVGNRETDIK